MDEIRRLQVMVDYLFGRDVGAALPKSGYRFEYSRRSGRLKHVLHRGKLVATVKPSGAMALTVYGAKILSRSTSFAQNFVEVGEDAAEFVVGGKSVFCKFVKSAGRNIHPKSEVVVVDGRARVLGVGTAVLDGKHMTLFKSGVAVKVREGSDA